MEINRLVPETEEEKAIFQEVSPPLATCASIFDICFIWAKAWSKCECRGTQRDEVQP